MTRKENEKQTDRENVVRNMQLMLIPILMKTWHINSQELKDLFDKYDVIDYIDVCYEAYNSMGINGIIEDLQEYIKMQGGSIRQQ